MQSKNANLSAIQPQETQGTVLVDPFCPAPLMYILLEALVSLLIAIQVTLTRQFLN